MKAKYDLMKKDKHSTRRNMLKPENILMTTQLPDEVERFHANSPLSNFPLHTFRDSLTNLLEEYIFNNAYHSPLDDLIETYKPHDFQITYDACPVTIPCAQSFKQDNPELYARLAYIHKSGKRACHLYAVHIVSQQHPEFYLDWVESGEDMITFAANYERQSMESK